MDNIINFKQRDSPKISATSHMFSLHMYMTSEGEYEVSMEISEEFSDEETFEALLAAAMKFGTEHAQELEISEE